MRGRAIFVFLVFTFAATGTEAGCTSPNGEHSNTQQVRLMVTSGAANLVNGGAGAIQAGANQWNNASCRNSGPASFPEFIFTGSGDETIRVVSVPGASSGISSCGRTIFTGTKKILLFTKIEGSGGQLLDCDWSDASRVADFIAHELGHFLGLDHPQCGLCDGHIMSRPQYAIQAGTAVDVSADDEIKDAECDMADAASLTPEEDAFEDWMCQFDPDCDPYSPCFPNCGSPVVLDLDYNKFQLTGLRNPVPFDIDADGHAEWTAWTRGDRRDAFLCLDRNGNNIIDDGGELFGDSTLLANGHRARHGYLALAETDRLAFGGNADGRITAEDEQFELLRLWIDANHDGFAEEGELSSLSAASVVELALDFRATNEVDRFGNWFGYVSEAWVLEDGRLKRIPTADVFFIHEASAVPERARKPRS